MTDDDVPTRAASFLESRALFLQQAALELHERLEQHAEDLGVMTRRLPPPGTSADLYPTAAGEVDVVRVTAARAKMMAELFAQWSDEGIDPLRQSHDLAIWQRIKDAARSFGVDPA